MTINRRSIDIRSWLPAPACSALPFAARADGTLEEAKKRGTFRVGVTQAPPWFSKDPKTGEWNRRVSASRWARRWPTSSASRWRPSR